MSTNCKIRKNRQRNEIFRLNELLLLLPFGEVNRGKDPFSASDSFILHQLLPS